VFLPYCLVNIQEKALSIATAPASGIVFGKTPFKAFSYINFQGVLE
jgi:hypothetical protein